MIFGIGCDTVSLARFAAKLGADPHLSPLAKRLFTEAELAAQMTVRSLAARFAAKEALIKALGGSTITAKVAEISEIAAASDRETFCETFRETSAETAGIWKDTAKPAKHAAEPTAEPAQKHSLNWHDIEILPSRGNRPVFSDTPRLARVLHAAGVAKLHLSLSHDGDSAQAFVVAERAGARSIAVAAGAEVGA